MRVTPAYAGSTIAPTHVRRSSQEHPRTCGEHSLSCQLLGTLLGAPPHMRGAHYQNGGNTPISLPKTDEKLQFKHSSLIKQHSWPP